MAACRRASRMRPAPMLATWAWESSLWLGMRRRVHIGGFLSVWIRADPMCLVTLTFLHGASSNVFKHLAGGHVQLPCSCLSALTKKPFSFGCPLLFACFRNQRPSMTTTASPSMATPISPSPRMWASASRPMAGRRGKVTRSNVFSPKELGAQFGGLPRHSC